MRINSRVSFVQRLRTKCEVQYWLMRAYAEQHPEKSSNRFFLCRHCEVLNTAFDFLEHLLDYPPLIMDKRTAEEDEEYDTITLWQQTSCVGLGLVELARNALFNRRSLPELDEKLESELLSEAELACKLLTGDERAEIEPDQPLAVQAQKASEAKKSKKQNSTPGSTDAKILGALCIHHQYDASSCMNMEPIIGNKLAELAEVAQGSVTAFWNRRFRSGDHEGTYEDYRRACGNNTLPMKLATWLGEAPTEDAYQLWEKRITAKQQDGDD